MDPLQKFNKIIGSGGFGLILKREDKDQVVKLLYSGGCKQAREEYEKNMAVYNALSVGKYDQITVPKPLMFNMENIKKNDMNYSCFYIMSYIHPIKGEKVLYHIINDEYKSLFNKVVGRVYSNPVSDKNPPRGFFATYEYIQKMIEILPIDYKGDLNSMKKVIKYMGYAFGMIIFVANYKPIDVEYVLGEKDSRLALGVLDFGMIQPIDWTVQIEVLVDDVIDDIIDIDLYFPTPGTMEMGWFLEGMKDALIDDYRKIEFFKILEKKLE